MIKRINSSIKTGGFALMELLVVVGIFSLIIGVSFTVISTGRLSVFLSEAQIQAEESARIAMARLSKELRLAKASEVYIYEDIDTPSTTNPITGPVVYLRIPVGSYSDNLQLTGGSLQWGTEDEQGDYLAYYLDSDGQLLRNTYNNNRGSDYQTGYGTIIIPRISSLIFSRDSVGSDLLTIQITGQGESATQTATRSLTSKIKLRN